MHDLPPLHAVRAFEAAARHLSFNRAAEELHVTPSAISHQVRALEEHLGIKLFDRLTRRVILTRDGQAFLPAVQGALEQIGAAAERIQAKRDDGSLTVQASPNFATEWLVPRLLGFQAEYPDIEVKLMTTRGQDGIRFDFAQVDLAIWYGTGSWPDVDCERLLREELVPVCSPDLLRGEAALTSPEDLRGATLIHVLIRIGQWRNWLAAAGIDDIDPERGPKFQNTPLALEAAMAGIGVAIANRAFVADHLRDGRLVIPFDHDLSTDSAYYLIYPKQGPQRASAIAFREWIRDVLASEREGISGLHEHLPGQRAAGSVRNRHRKS
jgi:LysR family glycine cleavage system transcriptional activator